MNFNNKDEVALIHKHLSTEVYVNCGISLSWIETVRKYIEYLETKNKELTEENRHLEYTLLGVMHSVDKWLDGVELEMDEVNRAITMREKTLQIVENLTEKWEEAVNQVNYIADITRADTVHKMQTMIKEECLKGGIWPAFVARVVENVGKKLLEGKNDV